MPWYSGSYDSSKLSKPTGILCDSQAQAYLSKSQNGCSPFKCSGFLMEKNIALELWYRMQLVSKWVPKIDNSSLCFTGMVKLAQL